MSPKVNAEILRLESERDIVIETGRETTQTQEEVSFICVILFYILLVYNLF